MRLVLAFVLLPGLAAAEINMQTNRYVCDRGLEVPVTYVNDGETSVVVLMVEGRMVNLYGEEAASGARYGWPSDGSNYVWWSQGDTAMLLWKDETGAETPVLPNCQLQQ
jgi:membrane-bound inhibitor of C-type lysozyme